MEKYTAAYNNVPGVLKNIVKEQQQLEKLPTPATQLAVAKTLVVDKVKAESLAMDLLGEIGHLDRELEESHNENVALKGENKILKTKLDQQNIVYEDELEKFRKGQGVIATTSTQSDLERGLARLVKMAKRNSAK